jgi:hypothetical protein
MTFFKMEYQKDWLLIKYKPEAPIEPVILTCTISVKVQMYNKTVSSNFHLEYKKNHTI